MVLAQVFGLLPVRGVTSKSAADLSFSFKNFRTMNSVFVVMCYTTCMGLTYSWALKQQFKFDTIETIIFYTSIFSISVAFFNLARKWPSVMKQWELVESKLPPLQSQMEKRKLSHQIKMITTVTCVLSLIEHILSMLSSIYYANACPARPDPIESYLQGNFIQLFSFVDYNNWLGMFGKYLNVLSTFAWNFTDIFIMTVSVGLSSGFRQLNADLLKMARKPTTEAYWINSRVNYRNLCKLCDKVDDAVSSITLLGFSNNLYFICGKIMKSIQKKPSFTHTLYFWFSLFYLLGRTLALSLYSADIHDESRRPMLVFRAVPREYWCKEIKRFAQEVSTDLVALSGMKFFHLTRSLVLSVAGTIVTYELVLLQFNKEEVIGDCFQ
ncbi:gustatory receptor for sugar taste 64e-like isoform X2 [Eupeodes corollae]|nr:gustatory receptor for sugar taste 64e-like isoform X2 [Eupeodes corollae]